MTRFTTAGRTSLNDPSSERTIRATDGSAFVRRMDRRYGLSRGLAVLGAGGWVIAGLLLAGSRLL